MTEGHGPELARRAGSEDTRWITAAVALLATLLFAVSGTEILPAIVTCVAHGGALPRGQATTLLLDIALVLLAWRRSRQLKNTRLALSEVQSRAYNLAYYDEVTGLFNRRRLTELVEQLCVLGATDCALLFIDLDHFKKVNDLYGHAAGDELLITVAGRLRQHCPEDADCVRLGGDEFAVLLQGSSAGSRKVKQLAGVLLEELQRPVPLPNTLATIGISIGICIPQTEFREPGTLFKRADAALYEAKRLGRNRAVMFDISMETRLSARAKLEADMREGIERGEFVPYFQPIVDLASGDVRGFEVLARWEHPTRGLLEPPEFLDLAEATGLISDLSFSVMLQALTIARKWANPVKLAVNISPVQFNDPLIAQRIQSLLEATGFPASRLELEIMERSLLEDHQTALETIATLRESGISIAVDDLGSIYGSLAMLSAMPFDRIKIDRNLIGLLLDSERGDTLVQAIASLGRGLNLPVTAEGIETEALHERLADLGCVDAQGWLFGKALTAEEVRLFFETDVAGRPSGAQPARNTAA